jgi:hypothetical protein
MASSDKTQTVQGSEYNQVSFLGGMNLLGDDSRLAPNQYRAGFNLTNRYDTLDPMLKSKKDVAAPVGLKQELVTFGNFEILFVAGAAYYKYYLSEGWTQIVGFQMSSTAPRLWTVSIPVATTNYVRIAATGVTNTGTSDPNGQIQLSNIAAAAQGNLPGLLVQDNVSQPLFIFLDNAGTVQFRTTQTFAQWSITFTDATNTVVAPNGDKREYVPIGNSMAWEDGVLYITAQDGQSIYRSVSGRPLDFMVNVVNTLVTVAPFTQVGGGDATTTSYSVGVGGISCLRPMSSGGIFVAASNANFLVTKNMSNNAPRIFGEYTFLRTFLFNSTCLSDRVIFDSIGDTRFISLTGVRSFNAISQTLNEGRNVAFTAQIAGAFGSEDSPIIQDASAAAAILFNDYELYAVNTIFNSTIIKYDTLSKCWSSFDIGQADGKPIKILAKIELTVRKLYAITTDNELYQLYVGPETDEASFRSVGICANVLYADSNVKLANPKSEIKLGMVRAIINRLTEQSECSMIPYVNNRLANVSESTKVIRYEDPAVVDDSNTRLPDVNTQLMNILWTTPNCKQGWKVFLVFRWTSGSFTQFSTEMSDTTPMNPLNSQILTR